MIQANQLRIGNRVFWNPRLLRLNTGLKPMQIELTAVLPDKIAYVSPTLEHRVEPFEDELSAMEPTYEPLEEIEPVPLTEEWLLKLPREIKYPDWIKYVHELQNWYFWNHNKNELPLNE